MAGQDGSRNGIIWVVCGLFTINHYLWSRGDTIAIAKVDLNLELHCNKLQSESAAFVLCSLAWPGERVLSWRDLTQQPARRYRTYETHE